MAITQGDWADPENSPEVRQVLRDRLAQRVADFNRTHPNPSPKGNALDQLTEKLNAQLAKSVNDAIAEKTAPTDAEVRQAAKDGAVLDFNGDSTCFSSLSYEDDGSDSDTGIVTAMFTNGYGPYTAPLDLDTFLEWTAESAGKYFNEVLGQDFFAATKAKD